MPWKEIRVEEQRLLVVQDREEGMSISELAEIHGVSRKTIYKWLDRYQEQGVQGLRNPSRRRHHSPNQVSAEVEAAIVEARQRWRWGPGKLRVKLCGQDSSQQWPALPFADPIENLDQPEIDLPHLHVDAEHLDVHFVAQAVDLPRVLAAQHVSAVDEAVIVVGHRRDVHHAFDEVLDELDEQAEPRHAGDIAFELIADLVGHELHLLPLQQL